MYFSTFAELCNMGGHGFYVWMAYGIAFLTLSILVVQPLLKSKQALKAISQRKLHDSSSNNSSSNQESSL